MGNRLLRAVLFRFREITVQYASETCSMSLSISQAPSRDVAVKDCLEVLVDDKPRPDEPGVPSTVEECQTTRLTVITAANATSKRAKSTCACSPGGVQIERDRSLHPGHLGQRPPICFQTDE